LHHIPQRILLTLVIGVRRWGLLINVAGLLRQFLLILLAILLNS
jgi:hypothetical protein